MVLVPNWDALVAVVIPNVIAIACVFPAIGQISNKDGTAWYQTLKKPSWVMPAFTYGPIYAYMYTSLGYASYLVYADSSCFKDKNEIFPTALYGAHLLLSLIACTIFYKYHKLGFTFFLMLILDALLLALTISFYQINSYSAVFLIPIQLWQTYGTLIMHAFWVLNTKQLEDFQALKA